LGGKDAGRWTPSDPFRPDKFCNRIAIFVSIFEQIIHVSHSRSRERQPKPLAAPRGFTEDPREGRNIGRASRRSPPSAFTLLLSQSLVNELVSKILANIVLLESHQAAAPDFPTTSLLPLRSQGGAAFLVPRRSLAFRGDRGSEIQSLAVSQGEGSVSCRKGRVEVDGLLKPSA
jgi:hypothetical protein